MLAAVSVTVAMRTVGLLLVSALMVVPVATAQQLTRSFRTTLLAAMALGTLASVGGLVLSAFASFHAGSRPARRSCCWRWPGSRSPGRSGAVLRARRAGPGAVPRAGAARRTRSPTSTRTSTARTAATWRSAHGDHVDYVHDGHRHAAHGKHYDEH